MDEANVLLGLIFDLRCRIQCGKEVIAETRQKGKNTADWEMIVAELEAQLRFAYIEFYKIWNKTCTDCDNPSPEIDSLPLFRSVFPAMWTADSKSGMVA